MKQTRLIFLALSCAFLLAATSDGHSHRPFPTENGSKAPPITFTLETKEKVVQFFDPLAIRVVLHDNFSSPISFDSRTLRLIPESWHVVGTWGEWTEGDGLRLSTENHQTGKIELAAGASLSLVTIEQWPTFESLGPVRVDYKLSSTDPAIKNLFPASYGELSFVVPPSKLISDVWAAQTEAKQSTTQPSFNEFLRFRAEAQNDDEKKDFQKRLRDRNYAAKTIFYMAGYALPFLERAARDKDSFVREQAVLAYSYAARAIEQLDAFLDALDEIGPRPQWASALTKNRNKEKADWRMFALTALNDPAPNVRTAAVSVLTKKDWDQYGFDVLQAAIGYPKSPTVKSGGVVNQGGQSEDSTSARNAP